MKINLLILFVVLSVFLFSCESNDKWINQYDSNINEAEIQKICQSNNVECGIVSANYHGTIFDVNCGKCADGYECNDDNKCQDINECAQASLNNCKENTVCANEEGTYSCICKDNYSGDDCVPDTRMKDCEGLPENATWNTVSNIEQTWDGSNWTPSNKGIFNEESSKTECRFKCTKNFTWNGSKCEANTNIVKCTGLPENAQWNSVSEITQTWDGSNWTPSNKGSYNEKASTTECHYICKTNYEWNGSECVAATRTEKCTGLPNGAVWNTVSEIKQTWDGSNWQPDTNGEYNENASTDECRFKCGEHYNWIASDSKCEAETQETNCPPKPANTVWNDNGANGKFIQTWDGSDWNPVVDSSVYSTTAEVCHYICETDYHIEDNQCVFNTKIAECSAKPANSSWNDNGAYGTFTQNWTGSTWTPADYQSTYNKTAGICVFVCNQGYIWENSSCETAPTQQANCSAKPANTVWNDNGANGRFTQTYDGSVWEPANYPASYSEAAGTCRYKCAEHYTWNPATLKCDADTQQVDCSSKPENTVWNDNGANGQFTQTWTGIDWDPASYTSTYNTTAGVCRYKCDSTHTWENGSCINQKTSYCTGLPAEHASWNTASSITQNWSSSNGWQPSTTGTFNEAASTNRCYFKCDTHYSWNSSTSKCVADTQSANCTGLPTNAVWNTASSITQTWNGNTWTPSNVGTYNETPSSGECLFKCNSGYHWENSACISNTRTANCTWNGNSWTPSVVGIYNETPSSNECHFKCNSGYHRENSACISNTRSANCTGLPANSVWNTASSITQNWSSANGWQPTTTGTYSATPSTNQCYYKCASGYTRENGSCINQKTANCTGLPANAQWNTVSSITQTWNGNYWTPSTTGSYNNTASDNTCRFVCKKNYDWDYSTNRCVTEGDTRVVNCSSIPNHASYNTVSCITQTYTRINGGCDDDYFEWEPYTTSYYSETPSTTECHYKCDDGYQYGGSSMCVAVGDTITGDCYGLPANAEWNTVSSITQTWNGSNWTPTTTKGTYNTTASTTECRYKCKSGYTWDGSSMCVVVGDTKTGYCTGLPQNAEWNTVSSITQTWNGSNWTPTTTAGTYNTTASTTECRYKCLEKYYWNGETCRISLGKICTGQTNCYNNSSSITCPTSATDDFFGQDAQYTGKCTAQSFTASSNVVIDNNTGLTWEKSPSSSTYTWYNRATHCNELNSSNYGGKNNWRVPNPLELLTIVNNSTYDPATNSNFTGMPTSNSTYLWTNSEYKGNTSYAYYFSPSYGWYYYNGKTSNYKVLCVNGEEMKPAILSDFMTSSDGKIVTDNRTGLKWQKEYATGKTWQQALKYCEDLSYAGYTDWRLPNKNELTSLVNYEKSGSPYSYFPDMPSNFFWSSSTHLGDTGYAWRVGFDKGGVDGSYKTSSINVRCVRSE